MQNNLDIITVFNPDPDPFQIRYDGKSYGTIVSGKARRMIRSVAKLAVKHLIDQCINTTGGNTADQALRDQWAAKIVIDEEVYMEPEVISAEEKIQKDMDRLNAGQDLDRILSKHNANGEERQSSANFTPKPTTPTPDSMPQKPIVEASGQSTAPIPPTTAPASMTPSEPIVPPQTTSRVADDLGIKPPSGEGKKLTEIDNTDAPVTPPTPPATKPPPTREELYAYASGTLGMTLTDEKTKAALDAQDIPSLIKTLGYDVNSQ